MDTWSANSYTGQGVIADNIAFFNGSAGFEAVQNTAGAHIYFENNTSASNSTQAARDSAVWGVHHLWRGFQLVEMSHNISRTATSTACDGNTNYAFNLWDVNSTSYAYANFAYSAAGNETYCGGICTGFSFGPNNVTGSDPDFANLPTAPPGEPSCRGTASVQACMATIIADFTPTNPAAAGYGYQPVSATGRYDPLFPQWLCPYSSQLAGLVTMGCVTGTTVSGASLSAGVYINSIFPPPPTDAISFSNLQELPSSSFSYAGGTSCCGGSYGTTFGAIPTATASTTAASLAVVDAPFTTSGELNTVSLQYYAAPPSGQQVTIAVLSGTYPSSLTVVSSFTLTVAASTAVQTFKTGTNYSAVAVTAGEYLGVYTQSGIGVGTGTSAGVTYAAPSSASLPTGAQSYTSSTNGVALEGQVGTTSVTFANASPSLSGSSINLTSIGDGYNSQIFTTNICVITSGGECAGMTDVIVDAYLYIPSTSSTPHGIEGPNLPFYNGSVLMYPSIQCATNSGSTTPSVATWNIWSGTAWEPENISCAAIRTTTNAWIYYQVLYRVNIAAGTFTYVTLVVNSVPIFQNLGTTYNGISYPTGDSMKAQFQLDGAESTGAVSTFYIDNWNVWVW